VTTIKTDLENTADRKLLVCPLRVNISSPLTQEKTTANRSSVQHKIFVPLQSMQADNSLYHYVTRVQLSTQGKNAESNSLPFDRGRRMPANR
jgi:hypothetical protein